MLIPLGERIRYVGTVPDVDRLQRDPKVKVIHGRGRTLMSGLGDAHTHFTWNNGALNNLGDMGVEEHTILTARSAQVYLDSGYTMLVFACADQCYSYLIVIQVLRCRIR
jgi:imidazolonepropionase-like amidohydrolase